jgi:hypothetical protein
VRDAPLAQQPPAARIAVAFVGDHPVRPRAAHGSCGSRSSIKPWSMMMRISKRLYTADRDDAGALLNWSRWPRAGATHVVRR